MEGKEKFSSESRSGAKKGEQEDTPERDVTIKDYESELVNSKAAEESGTPSVPSIPEINISTTVSEELSISKTCSVSSNTVTSYSASAVSSCPSLVATITTNTVTTTTTTVSCKTPKSSVGKFVCESRTPGLKDDSPSSNTFMSAHRQEIAAGGSQVILSSDLKTEIADDSSNKLLQAVRSKNLPYPLPTPSYSQAVQAARASGNVLSERATIIRETVKYFLAYKYWWTSDDYDRIAELVVNEFPELQDPFTWPSQPCYSKVRLDLSMCARNIRRIAKNHEKRRGSPKLQSPGCHQVVEENNKRVTNAGKVSQSKIEMQESTKKMGSRTGKSTTGQLLPHTAHTAQAKSDGQLLDHNQVASLPYLLTSAASPAPTVLPPVAHFLGHSQGLGGIVFPSLATPSAVVTASSTTSPSGVQAHMQITGVTSKEPTMGIGLSGLKSTGSQFEKQGRRDDDSASVPSAWEPDVQLPDPLPVPPYSDKVIKAQKMGIVKYERPLIIRETVLFFLSLKYWWSSVDYDRISDLVVEYFPDLRDPGLSPNVPPNRRVRADLSQTARNIRRREGMLRRRDSKSPEDRFAAVGTVTMSSLSGQQPSTDFCNELLTAASIIESRHAALLHKELPELNESQMENTRETAAEDPTVPRGHGSNCAKGGQLQALSDGMLDSLARIHRDEIRKEEQTKELPASFSTSGTGLKLSDTLLSETAGSNELEAVQEKVLRDVNKRVVKRRKLSEVQAHPNQNVAVSPAGSLDVVVIKHEVDDMDRSRYEDLGDDHSLITQSSQALQNISAQMSQALSVQSMKALSAQISHTLTAQALSAACISDHLMSAQLSSHPSLIQHTSPPAAHQNTPATSSAAVNSLSLQQLSPAHIYSLTAGGGVGAKDELSEAAHADRMSAMAMWRSTCLPDPLPTPPFSLNVLRARDSGNTASARPRIIRETTQFFLAMKMWWTTQDYERIAELVLRHFPALQSVQNIKKDLGTCARNMRRRLPISRHKPSAYAKQWCSLQSTAESHGKEADSDDQAKGSGLTLGELATMASLREAVGQQGHEKGMLGTAGLAVLTEEQRQALLAHSMYEQSTLAWNALYQQFSMPSETLSSGSHLHGTTRSLSDTCASRVVESDENDDGCTALKRASLSQPLSKQVLTMEEREKVPVDGMSEGIRPDVKMEPVAVGNRRRSTSDAVVGNKTHSLFRLHSSQLPSVQSERNVSVNTPATPSSPRPLIHAHQNPVRAHSQLSQVRPELSNIEEAPINLTCGSDTSKQQNLDLEREDAKADFKLAKPKNRTSSMDTFSAREQVWFPHGSPWKKSGQNIFKALPSPLPVPKYSQKLLKAKDEGLAYRHRSEIIRETARFFLGFKYWWSSADYSRISELVVSQFPDLKDPVIHPGQPLYRRVQRDLSMCARNLRRKNTRRQKLTLSESSRSPRKTKGIKAEKDWEMEADVLDAGGSSQTLRSDSTQGAKESKNTAAYSIQEYKMPSTNKVKRERSDSSRDVTPVSHSLAGTGLSGSISARNSVKTTAFTTMPTNTSSSSVTFAASQPSHFSSATATAVSYDMALSNDYQNTCTNGHSASKPGQSFQNSQSTPRSETGKQKKTSSSVSSPAVTSQRHTLCVDESLRKSILQTVSSARYRIPGSHHPQDLQWGHSGASHSQAGFSRSPENEVKPVANATTTLNETPPYPDPRDLGNSVSNKVYIDPDHGSELQAQLNKLWQDGKFFDASLEVDGCRLPVHKLILLAASPYLQSTFRHANPTSQLEVNLPRATGVSAAKDFLKYVYQGVLHVGCDTVHALRRIATMLQMDKLLAYCDDYLSLLASSISHSTCPSTLPHAAAQVSKVSVNLRDVGHNNHLLTSSQSSGDLSTQAVEANSAMSILGSARSQLAQVALPGMDHSLSVSATSVHHDYRSHGCNGELKNENEQHRHVVLERRGMASLVMPPKKSVKQPNDVVVGVTYAGSELRKLAEEFDQAGSEQKTGSYGHFHVTNISPDISESQDQMEQALPLHLHGQEKQAAGRGHISSVIQRGPNMTSASHAVGHAGTSGILVGQDGAVQFLSDGSPAQHMDDADRVGTVLAQPQVEDVMAMLPHGQTEVVIGRASHVQYTDSSVDDEVLSSASLQHLTEDGGDVVEVVVGPSDLLQDVEVAACETVECSLLPQTYCSSPTASHSHSPSLDKDPAHSLPELTSHWPPASYQNSPHFDMKRAADQWEVLPASGHPIAVTKHVVMADDSPVADSTHQMEQVDWQEDHTSQYRQHCMPSASVYVAQSHSDVAAQMMLSSHHCTVNESHPHLGDNPDGSLLPQTYRSSPEQVSSENSQ